MVAVKTILLVDDDREILSTLQTFLEVKGYRVVTAYDGQLGLEMAASVRPDVVVVDMLMPKKSGFVVLDALKSRRDYRPSVIMMTAQQSHQHRAYAEILGADDYLNKPFGLDQLLASVERLCGPAA